MARWLFANSPWDRVSAGLVSAHLADRERSLWCVRYYFRGLRSRQDIADLGVDVGCIVLICGDVVGQSWAGSPEPAGTPPPPGQPGPIHRGKMPSCLRFSPTTCGVR